MQQGIETKPLTDCDTGDVVEGTIIAVDRSMVYIDLSPVGTGIIYGREFTAAKDILRKVKIGDSISAQIIDLHTPEGYIDLSLKEARKAYIWNEAEEAVREGRSYDIVIKNANRGGLIAEWNGIRCFLPASHLSEEHYPKTLNGDKETVLAELKKLVNKKLSVIIESIDPANEAIIISEHKHKGMQTAAEGVDVTYKVGDTKNGIVTGVVDFGVFVTIDNGIEGLVHISEMDWGLVDDPHKFYSVGNRVQVKIIEIDGDKYSLSFKELQKNPWEDLSKRHKINDIVNGVIIKHSQFGAFASIEAGVSGLVHISNFENEQDLQKSLEIGKTYEFVITYFEPESQKLIIVPKDRHNEKNKHTA